MRNAVNLDSNPWPQTRKVQNIWPDRMLPPKAKSTRSNLQSPPHHGFGQVPALPFLPRLLDHRARGGKHPTTTLRELAKLCPRHSFRLLGAIESQLPLPRMGRYLRTVTHHRSYLPVHGEGDHAQHGGGVGAARTINLVMRRDRIISESLPAQQMRPKPQFRRQSNVRSLSYPCTRGHMFVAQQKLPPPHSSNHDTNDLHHISETHLTALLE